MVLATGAAIGYAASVGEESLTNWLLKEDGTVDVEGNPLPIDSSDGMTVGSSYWSASDYVNSMQGGDGFAVARQAYYNYMARGGNTNPQAPNCQQNNDTQIQCANIVAVFKPSGSLNMCGQGFYFANEQCKPYSYPAPSSVPAQSDLTAQQAVDSLPTSDLSRNLSPAYVAAVANIMWSRAAMEPGYDGVPYSNSKQITSNDVKAWMDANPNYTPTVADFTSPAPSSSSTAYTLPGTATSSAPQAINPNATSTPLNLGPDPAIDAPTLQSTPTAEAILSPALDLMPDLKNLVLPETTAECPKPILYVFDTEIEFSAHCILLEDYHLKEIIQGLMMFFWALAAAIVVLTA
ncbi:hypothetical protein [Paraperlucidibaca sp.]|uniref:hypothetical protein n=1 Tax=Paraperlucidibaca sp. TaxID=2708021 RepID=UPI0030F42B4F